MPDIAKYQEHMNNIAAALKAAHEANPTSLEIAALHVVLADGAALLAEDNPGLVVPDAGGGPKGP